MIYANSDILQSANCFFFLGLTRFWTPEERSMILFFHSLLIGWFWPVWLLASRDNKTMIFPFPIVVFGSDELEQETNQQEAKVKLDKAQVLQHQTCKINNRSHNMWAVPTRNPTPNGKPCGCDLPSIIYQSNTNTFLKIIINLINSSYSLFQNHKRRLQPGIPSQLPI